MSLNSANHKKEQTKKPSSENVLNGVTNDKKSVSSKVPSRQSSTSNATGSALLKKPSQSQSSQKQQEPDLQSLRDTQSQLQTTTEPVDIKETTDNTQIEQVKVEETVEQQIENTEKKDDQQEGNKLQLTVLKLQKIESDDLHVEEEEGKQQDQEGTQEKKDEQEQDQTSKPVTQNSVSNIITPQKVNEDEQQVKTGANFNDMNQISEQQKNMSPSAKAAEQFKNIQQDQGSDFTKLSESQQFNPNASGNNVDGKPAVKVELPPNPILPKTFSVETQPPECPLSTVKFKLLEKFKQFMNNKPDQMGTCYDLVGKRRQMKEKRKKEKEDQIRKAGQNIDDLEKDAKMNDSTHYIQNVVFARDPTIFETKTGYVEQRRCFAHENQLDIKKLIRMQEQANNFYESSMSPSMRQRRQSKTKQEIQLQQEREARITYKLQGEDDKTLLFESRFECGNLYLAQKVNDSEYNLLMQNDINTSGHTQWFFFRVQNTKKNKTVKFNIMNYSKPDSLFNYGMKVSIYSEEKAKAKQVGWFKGGQDISYFANGIRKDFTQYSRSYYSATFTYKFEHSNDTVFFAYSIPYTYCDLQQDLSEIEMDPQRRQFCQRKTLCKTIANEKCEILTVTSKGSEDQVSERKAVVLSGRVHPGETVGSWMMRGALLFITDPVNPEAKILRDNFVFKIIPMLNPDGVINGNYRCSLAGCDLNRRWKAPSKMIHPTVYYSKKLIKNLHAEREVLMYCDFHGHSRKQNVFMYGCNNKAKPEETRIFPYMMSKLNQYFSFENCRFGVQKSKESTARVAVYKELKTCANIFTIESSFSGLDMGPQKGMHFTTDMLQTLGRDVCRTVLLYTKLYIPEELQNDPLFKQQGDTKAEDLSNMIVKELKNSKSLMQQGDGDSSSGSDSEPSEDNLQADELSKVIPVVEKSLKIQIQKIKQQKEQAQQKPQVSPRKPLQQKKEDLKIQPKQMQKPPQKPVEEKKTILPDIDNKNGEKEKKPKPEMKDAQTQTDRSDYSIIKKRMLSQQQQSEAIMRQKELLRWRGKNQQKQSSSNQQNYRKSPSQLNGLDNIFNNRKDKSKVYQQEKYSFLGVSNYQTINNGNPNQPMPQQYGQNPTGGPQNGNIPSPMINNQQINRNQFNSHQGQPTAHMFEQFNSSMNNPHQNQGASHNQGLKNAAKSILNSSSPGSMEMIRNMQYTQGGGPNKQQNYKQFQKEQQLLQQHQQQLMAQKQQMIQGGQQQMLDSTGSGLVNHHRKFNSDVVKYHSNISGKDNSRSELGGLNQDALLKNSQYYNSQKADKTQQQFKTNENTYNSNLSSNSKQNLMKMNKTQAENQNYFSNSSNVDSTHVNTRQNSKMGNHSNQARQLTGSRPSSPNKQINKKNSSQKLIQSAENRSMKQSQVLKQSSNQLQQPKDNNNVINKEQIVIGGVIKNNQTYTPQFIGQIGSIHTDNNQNIVKLKINSSSLGIQQQQNTSQSQQNSQLQPSTTNSSKFARESLQNHMIQGGSTANAMQYQSKNNDVQNNNQDLNNSGHLPSLTTKFSNQSPRSKNGTGGLQNQNMTQNQQMMQKSNMQFLSSQINSISNPNGSDQMGMRKSINQQKNLGSMSPDKRVNNYSDFQIKPVSQQQINFAQNSSNLNNNSSLKSNINNGRNYHSKQGGLIYLEPTTATNNQQAIQNSAQPAHSTGQQPQNSSILYGSQYHSSPKHGSQTGASGANGATPGQSNHNSSLYSSITNHQINQIESQKQAYISKMKISNKLLGGMPEGANQQLSSAHQQNVGQIPNKQQQSNLGTPSKLKKQFQ